MARQVIGLVLGHGHGVGLGLGPGHGIGHCLPLSQGKERKGKERKG
jgi:hypothetical protein